MKRLALAVLLACASGLSWGQGAVIAIGGALRFDNDAVWQRIVDEAGGKGARIAVLANGSANPERAGGLAAETLNRRGARAQFIAVPFDPERLRETQGVFIAGGAQDRIVATLTGPMLEAVRAVQRRGGVIAGTSAGAAVMSERMIRDAPDAIAVLQGRMREGQEYGPGLGFAGPGMLIDQHFLRRGRIGRLLPLMQAMGYRRGLGVEENSAVVLRGHAVDVIGARGALLVEMGEVRKVAPFDMHGAMLSYLDHGDRHDLRSGKTTLAAVKQQPVEPSDPGEGEPSFRFDMLGNNTIVAAMSELAGSTRSEARGLAADAHSDVAFEFRLHKGEGTAASCSSASGAEECSVLKLRLDVQPVRLKRPFYEPLK